jgi:hypothetical protein
LAGSHRISLRIIWVDAIPKNGITIGTTVKLAMLRIRYGFLIVWSGIFDGPLVQGTVHGPLPVILLHDLAHMLRVLQASAMWPRLNPVRKV